MSDILDALRKAELAREHARAPGLSTQQRYTAAPSDRSHHWRWGVLGAFVLGLGCAGVLAIYTGRGGLAVAPAAASSRAPESLPATPLPSVPAAVDAGVPRTVVRPPGLRRAPAPEIHMPPAEPAAPAAAPTPELSHPEAGPERYITPVSLQHSVPVDSPADDLPIPAAEPPRAEEPPVAAVPQQVAMLHESPHTSPRPQVASTAQERSATVRKDEAPATTTTENSADPVPLLRTLPYRFQSIVPKLVINAQAYAEAAEDRFVIINMKKYAEGQQTAEGVIIEAIRKDDTVLVYQGQSFRLQR